MNTEQANFDREVMSNFDYRQSFQGNEGENDLMYAFDNDDYQIPFDENGGETGFQEQNLQHPSTFHYAFPSTQSQFWQPQQQSFDQNGNFTAWTGQNRVESHFPATSHSSAGSMPFNSACQSTFDTAFSTPTQASYYSPKPFNRSLDVIERNTASASDHKTKKQRIHASQRTVKDAYMPENTKQTSHPVSSVAQIELPYRNIWRMKQFNPMQSEMLTEVLRGDENVVVAAPTGAGKTVLFEMALVRMFQTYKDAKAVYLAPTKALCSEKFRDWNLRLREMNCKVLEMTGDSKITTPEEVKAARLIIATPEKWDIITRRAERADPLMSKLKLFLIDEVHTVREKVRGALLEVLIARTKSRHPDTRIIAVSATIPNADDVAQWIGSRQRSPRDKPETRKLTPFVFSDEFRPCPLHKEIYGFKPKTINGNYYDFERELTKQLPSVIEDHCKGKATLIFCSSRGGTQQVAQALYAHCQYRIDQNVDTPWPDASETNGLGFLNKDLQKFSNYGIAFHHAGLDLSDKRMVEAAFLSGKIKILCATTTLSVGVNLPAYLVIIRGTKLNTGTFQEHSDLTIRQMMGRAGRPQFDKEGVCVIMTEHDRREHYEQLLNGKSIIESTLHLNLIEHINAEICARGRCRAYNIEKWLKETFLFVRMFKNWEHYSIQGCSDQASPDQIVQTITRDYLEQLSKVDLLENYNSAKPDQEFSSTEYGRTMSNYSLRFRTMIDLMNLPRGANMQSLISTISQAQEFSDLFIRGGEKGVYRNILRNLKLRFPPISVENLDEKLSVLLQMGLTGFKIKEIMEREEQSVSANSSNEQAQIMKTAPKIARAMMNIAHYRKDGFFLNEAFTLSRSLHGKCWDDESATLTQLDGVGGGTMQLLSQHNINSIKALAKANPAELAMKICKSPAQASKLIKDAKKIPQIHLEAREMHVEQNSDGSVESTIKVTISLAHSQADLKNLHLQTREGKAISIGTVIYSTNTNAEECQLKRAGIWNFTAQGQDLEVKCRLLTASDEIVIVCAAEDISGSSVTKRVKTLFPADRFPLKNSFVPASSLVGALKAMKPYTQDPPIASTSAVTVNGRQRGE